MAPWIIIPWRLDGGKSWHLHGPEPCPNGTNKQSEPKVNPASVNNSSANHITTWDFRCADIPQPPTGRLDFLFGPVWTVNVDSVELDRRAIDPVTLKLLHASHGSPRRHSHLSRHPLS